jgi:hypothetical protein
VVGQNRCAPCFQDIRQLLRPDKLPSGGCRFIPSAKKAQNLCGKDRLSVGVMARSAQQFVTVGESTFTDGSSN